MSFFCSGLQGVCDCDILCKDCKHFTGEGGKEVKTNADRIRVMSDEELAEFLRWDICVKIRGDNRFCNGWCDECVLAWLRQPADNISDEILTEVQYTPAADVVERKRGEWVNERMLVGGFAEKWGCDCSQCGETIQEPLWKPNFCPNCGAKMDGGKSDAQE